jgi:ribosomal protein L27
MGRDHTLWAKVDGSVNFVRSGKNKRKVCVEPLEQ